MKSLILILSVSITNVYYSQNRYYKPSESQYIPQATENKITDQEYQRMMDALYQRQALADKNREITNNLLIYILDCKSKATEELLNQELDVC